MARYSQSDLQRMRSGAMRRAQEMHRSQTDYSFLPLREEPTPPFVSESKPKKQSDHMTNSSNRTGFSGFNLGGFHPGDLLEQLDSDKMMILALLVVLYRDGADKKLLMALAYLLT